MIRHPELSAARGLALGLDVLLTALLVVAVVQAPAGAGAVAVPTAVALAALYGWGRVALDVHGLPGERRRGAWWPDVAWVAALVAAWLVLLVVSPAALWLAFPLMLLQMHVLGPHRGVVAVAVTTVLAVVDGLTAQAGPGDPWTGFVLGPVLGGAVAIGVVLGIEAFVRESRSRQRTVDELTRARRHLAQAERERAVTDERARLARDIHDTLAQSLSAIELLLRAADDAVGTGDDRARTLVDQARHAARDGLAEARRVVQDLTPGDLERTTLPAALRRAAETAARSAAGDPPDVSVVTSGPVRALPVPVETALLRVAQSALANVVEHAAASRARVTVTYDPGTVTLDVVDDGVGFDPAHVEDRPGRGFGLPAIRARAAELGGTLALESRPGGGTAVAVTLPAGDGQEDR
ncbi:signal transduction histidine kinase [Isoptericola jiangsuensis]|uniref:Oxygen sensor histidine kinase NreB n=1 Tax=Isoptericola jiangsuensis TaxID=548579 RepID=A0A2A9F2D3_9MICO|nr:sensor histidine kinase [Isoptericola jiangsuensis]PFG44702.1 signal transduction histidine kinase [Isoptericola jiangsuensis]